MGEVVASTEIEVPAEAVFSLVKDTEKVVSFMPKGWSVKVQKLTEGTSGH